MIYFDNSSSSFYKPPSVINAVESVIKFLPYNPSRAAHKGALKAGMLLYHTRKNLADYFNCLPERVVFTGGCTEALNLAIFGSVKSGGHVITTPFEHNSVLRPLYHLGKTQGVKTTLVTNAKSAAAAIRPETCLIVVNHVSNVTGEAADIESFAHIAKSKDVPLLVDAAQSVGHLEIDMKSLGISMLAISPHKGLHAIQGVGVLMVDKNVNLSPFKFGGTGTSSSVPIQPTDFPEGFESGTLPLPAIASINAGLEFVKKNFDQTNKKLFELSAHLVENLLTVKGITVYSKPNVCGIVSFTVNGYTSQEVANILSERYDIAVRGGLHCAPLLHDYYKTKDGMVRASLGCDNTYADVENFLKAIREIAREKK